MAQKLSPVDKYRQRKYPRAENRMFRGILVVAGMTATSLGGCGPGIDSRSVDSALDQGDLDGAIDCDASPDAEGCKPAADGAVADVTTE
jgi:hypothetical protein